MKPVFEYQDYREYLLDSFSSSERKGIRSRFAEAIKVRSGYISQVCSGSANLSSEQADLASGFFSHTEEEALYFWYLVQYAKASTDSLKNRIRSELERVLQNRLDLKNRFQVKQKISEEDEAIFYSSWHYLAVFALLAIPTYRTTEKIAEKLGLAVAKTTEVLADLESLGLVGFKHNKYFQDLSRTHLGKNSKFIERHHQNWRLQAMQSIEKKREKDLHYSSVITLSEKDALRIKELLIQSLEKTAEIIQPSKDEKIFSLCMDLFEL
ncbi:MAG: TIGR02147 family protein [Oligoflexia bacterium]|nr:TIGR02147 family protein [Oligoflexia bacterium]